MKDGTVLPYAFGWYVQDYRGERLLWHSGWDEEARYSALFLKIPARKLTVILLANGGAYRGETRLIVRRWSARPSWRRFKLVRLQVRSGSHE